MDVSIIISETPSAASKKLMEFLMSVVNEYKKYLKMQINVVSKEDHKTLDKAITGLPAAYIKNKLVMGRANIESEIKEAYKKSQLKISADPVQDFWLREMTRPDESVKSHSDNISSKFTTMSQSRDQVRKARDQGGRHSANRPSHGSSRPPQYTPQNDQTQGSMTIKSSTTPPQQTPKSISALDPNRPSTMVSDPLMKMFWENQETITPDI